MPRLKEYADKATVIVYQSEWAYKMLGYLCGKGVVIYNGVDTDIFYPRKEKKDWDNIRIFYSKFSRNEVKQFHEVQYWWREYNLEKRGDTLVLVGRYADDKLKIDHPFEFHNEEEYEYKGIITDAKKLADCMRGCDIAFLPYMFDACSNCHMEIQACGIPTIYSNTGGSPEIIENGIKINYDLSPVEMVKIAIEKSKSCNTESYREKYSLQSMGERYNALFLTISGNQFEI
jgi:glycosyltransferase involved in cell wall biosynthesis